MYFPDEDSYLLEKEIKSHVSDLKSKNITVLDMGSGTGIQAKACISSGIKRSNILCVDIDKRTIAYLKKEKLKAIKSNLFSKIKKGQKFNLIIFNAPYLPEDKYDNQEDKRETTAGKKGCELIISFLRQAKSHLNKEGSILLLFSSLSKPKIILREAKKIKYTNKKLAEEKFFFEKLFVYEFTRAY
jgi:HemK-related putative methylase